MAKTKSKVITQNQVKTAKKGKTATRMAPKTSIKPKLQTRAKTKKKAYQSLSTSPKKSSTKMPMVKFELFVSGMTEKSVRAIEASKTLCETHLGSNYSLKITDIYRQPGIAKTHQIFAVPILIRCGPGPRKAFIGDLSDSTAVLKALGMLKMVRK